MKKTVLVLVGLAVGLLLVSAACGDGGEGRAKACSRRRPALPRRRRPRRRRDTAAETPPSAAELAADLTKSRQSCRTRSPRPRPVTCRAPGTPKAKGDEAIEAIIKAVRPVDASLADHRDVGAGLRGAGGLDTTDLTVIAKMRRMSCPCWTRRTPRSGSRPSPALRLTTAR